MAFEQYFNPGWKHNIPNATTEAGSHKSCFECSICLDFAQEPVVTLCGHLYCWPCIYTWLHIHSASLAPDEHPHCPVCKADISHTTMVPLYGSGQLVQLEGKPSSHGGMNMVIPPRPPACGSNQFLKSTANGQQQILPYRNPYQGPNHDHLLYSDYDEDATSSSLSLRNSSVNGFRHLMAGMFGDMVYSSVFGNSESLYANPNAYHLMGRGRGRGSSNSRLRRQEMQADKSLNRISVFFLCCAILCLILF